MDSKLKVRENFARRWAKRLELILVKSRDHRWSIDNHLGFMLITYDNTILAGEKYDLTLDEVYTELEKYEKKKRSE